jgi:hypothetical protein
MNSARLRHWLSGVYAERDFGRVTAVPGVFGEADFLDRAGLGEWGQRRAHGSFLHSE